MADDESERIEAAYALFNMAHNSRRPSVTNEDSAPTSPVTTTLQPATATPSPPTTAPTPTATIVQNSDDSDRMSFSLRGEVSAKPTRSEIAAASFKYNRTPVLPKIPRHAIMTRIQSLATSRSQARNASPLNSIGEVVTSPSDEAPIMRNLALTSMMTRSDSVPSLTRAGLPPRRLTRQLSEQSVTSPPPRLATTTNLSTAFTSSSQAPSTLYSPITPEAITASPLVRPQKSRDQNEPLDLSRDKNLRDAALTPLNLATHPLTSSASQAPRTPGTPMHQLAVLDGKIVLIPRTPSDVTTPSTDSNLTTSGSAVMSKARDMIANPSAYGFKLAYDSNHTLTLVPDRKEGASASAPALPLSNGHESSASTESKAAAELRSRRLSEEELRSALSPPKDTRAQSSLPPKKRRILESEENADVERKRARDDRDETRASKVASEAIHNVMQRLQSQVAQEVLELQSGQQRVQSLPAKLQPPSPLRTASTGSDDVQDMYKQKLYDEFTRCTDAQTKAPAFMHFPPQRVRGTDATTKVSISLKDGDNWRSTVAAKFSQRTPEGKARSESPPPLVSTKQAKRVGPSALETAKVKQEIPNKNGLQHHGPSTPSTPSMNGSSAAKTEAVEEVSEEIRRKCAKAGEPDEDGDL